MASIAASSEITNNKHIGDTVGTTRSAVKATGRKKAQTPKRKSQPTSNRKKQPTFTNGPTICPNPECRKEFRAFKHFASHVSQKEECRKFVSYLFKPTALQGKEKAAQQESTNTGQVPETELPNEQSENDASIAWDDESMGWPVTSDMEVEEEDVTTPITDANTGRMASHLARRFNIPFTHDQLIETQLLKVLNDVHAPHFFSS
jgi:hypothetical protein